MIFDEPSDGLDAENRHFFYEMIELWKADRHRCNQQCVIVSHDEEMTGSFDTVWRLDEAWRNGMSL